MELTAGVFVKQLIWNDALNVMIAAVSESEDSGYLLFYRVYSDLAEIKSFNIVIECLFSISAVFLHSHSKTLITVGGYPPLNIQINKIPSLEVLAEYTLPESFPGDRFGGLYGHSFSFSCQLLNLKDILVAYPGGSILIIDLVNGSFRELINDGNQWLYARIFSDLLLGVTIDGKVCLFNHSIELSNSEPLPVGSTGLNELVYDSIENNSPIAIRRTISPIEEPQDLRRVG